MKNFIYVSYYIYSLIVACSLSYFLHKTFKLNVAPSIISLIMIMLYFMYNDYKSNKE